MARPKKKAAERQGRPVTINLTESEYQRVLRKAGALPVGTWGRLTLLASTSDVAKAA